MPPLAGSLTAALDDEVPNVTADSVLRREAPEAVREDQP